MYTDDVVFVFFRPTNSRGHMGMGQQLLKSLIRQTGEGRDWPWDPGLHGKRLIHYTTAASPLIRQCKKCLSGPMIRHTTVLSSVNILKLYLAWPLLDIFPFH